MELILQLQVCSDLSHVARSCSRGYLSPYTTVSLWHVLLCLSAPALGYWWLASYFNNSLLPSPVLRPCLSYSVTLSLPASYTQTLATLEVEYCRCPAMQSLYMSPAIVSPSPHCPVVYYIHISGTIWHAHVTPLPPMTHST